MQRRKLMEANMKSVFICCTEICVWWSILSWLQSADWQAHLVVLNMSWYHESFKEKDRQRLHVCISAPAGCTVWTDLRENGSFSSVVQKLTKNKRHKKHGRALFIQNAAETLIWWTEIILVSSKKKTKKLWKLVQLSGSTFLNQRKSLSFLSF